MLVDKFTRNIKKLQKYEYKIEKEINVKIIY